MQAKYPPPPPSIDWYIETECGHLLSWSAVDLESLFIRLHEKNYRAKEVMTWAEHEELQAEMEMAAAFMKLEEERELKESA
ncbi:hypothetical protein D3C75_479890 [compost metagenome]